MPLRCGSVPTNAYRKGRKLCGISFSEMQGSPCQAASHDSQSEIVCSSYYISYYKGSLNYSY